MKVGLSLSLLALSSLAFGSVASMEKTQKAIETALESFQSDHPEHIKHFSGVKSWFEGDNVKVRIYMHEGSMTYECMDHGTEGTPEWMCHMQM